MDKQAFRAGAKAALPTGMGYLGIGLAFGVIAAAEGLSVFLVFLMSLLIYAGAGQFALIGLLVAGDSLSSITLTIFLINLRNFLMGLHTATIFPQASNLQNLFIGGLLTDESYGVMLGERLQTQEVSPDWMLGNNLLSYLSWVTATVLGALLGERVPDPYALGLDYALLAMFIGIFSSQFRGLELTEGLVKILKILMVVAISFLALVLIVPKALAVLLATLCGCATGVYLDGK